MPPAKHPDQDRNFDGLSARFKRNIYDSPKGHIRLAVLKRDFHVIGDLEGLDVLDAGCGQGQFAGWLLANGAEVMLTDISSEMLEDARFRLQREFSPSRFAMQRCDLRDFDEVFKERQFDVVCNHAVLEWLEEPLKALELIAARVATGGWLSLLFYNVHGLIFKNLLRANYKKVLAGDIKGQKGSLTPINPLEPTDVINVLELMGFEIEQHSGVRVFHDYILNRDDQEKSLEQMMQLELQFSQQEPYRGLGRYVHLLARRCP